MDRRAFLTAIAGLLVTPLAAEAQQTGKVYRIGWLGGSPWPPNDPLRETFDRAMRQKGWVEGQNEVRLALHEFGGKGNLSVAVIMAAVVLALGIAVGFAIMPVPAVRP
jgi:putative tryptophan/tyrosine transport system substrate-binding protein